MREEIEESLTYEPESAGRLMRKALVAVPEFWDVGDTIDFLRGAEELPEYFYVIYTVNAQFVPTGRVLLGTILAHKRETPLEHKNAKPICMPYRPRPIRKKWPTSSANTRWWKPR
jgi:magnesium transporter